MLKNSFFIRKRSLKNSSSVRGKGRRNFSPFQHPYLLSRPLSLLITDRKSLFFTDKNQYHISTHLVRETRRHKKHFPPPNTPPRYIFVESQRRFNLLTLPAILYSVVSFSFSLAPPFSSLPFLERRWLPMTSTKPNDPRLAFRAKESSKNPSFVPRSPRIFLSLIINSRPRKRVTERNRV